VRAIVEGHGGSLLVQSVVGRGTTMQVVLPLAHSPSVPVAAPDAGNAPSRSTV